jgi:thiamine biosynthesis protein ThiS
MPAVNYNDNPVTAPAGTTLKELLKLQGCDPGLVVVTVDGRFVPQAEYSRLVLSEGNKVVARELLDGG